ncbi:MAG: thioredoxin family protein [Chitinophaga sp.]|uniref:thioredoxin family protein n=1 Tax=Chitinophaga sp. TaxID=1869181 RepID=UPI0025C67EE6|nr:thioredoxin family protein [Chitinophaga sp.]MBV8251090.1 thioredoxin family protein [Chitinophaga sp.]
MKNILLPFLFVFISVAVFAQQTPPPAQQVLKEATEQASKEKKHVFIMFHASWCGWCHKMDDAMNDPSIRHLFDKNYVIRHITVQERGEKVANENPGGMELLTQYHGDDEGIPFWLIFGPDGKLVANSRMKNQSGELHNIGCPGQPDEIEYFLSILKSTSNMTARDLLAVKERFSKFTARN